MIMIIILIACHVIHACRYWLKQVITLVVVMGIAWIGNVLFFNANLIFVAYIMTIFIAGQGIIIFIMFVPLSKQVMCFNRIVFARNTDTYFQVIDAYKKWWRKRIKLSSAATFSETALQTKHVSILVLL